MGSEVRPRPEPELTGDRELCIGEFDGRGIWHRGSDRVGETPVRARKAEDALAKGSIDDAVKALDLEPTSDIQATADVKKHLAGVLLRRVAAQLMEARA